MPSEEEKRTNMVRVLCLPPYTGTPNGQLEGKFLQLRLAGEEWLVFGDIKAYRYHNQILAEFSRQRGLTPHWLGAERLEAAAVQVLGGGRFFLDWSSGVLEVWDNSSVYGSFQEERLGCQLIATDPPWSGLRLVMRSPS